MMGIEQYIREMWVYYCRERLSKKGFESRPRKKGKQEYGVSGSWNRQPESTWSKLNAAMTLTARTE